MIVIGGKKQKQEYCSGSIGCRLLHNKNDTKVAEWLWDYGQK